MKKRRFTTAKPVLLISLLLFGAALFSRAMAANLPPDVALTVPADNTTFVTPTDLLLQATASDPDGTVALVEFYRNGAKLGEDTTPPYELIWPETPAGLYALVAKATDNLGAASVSAAVNIVVREPSGSVTNSLIALRSDWKYLDNGSSLPTSWTSLGYNDGAWAEGPAQLGYGDGDESTVVSFGPDPGNKFVTTYFRRSFMVEDPTRVEGLSLSLLRDDGAIAYINGTEVFRLSLPAGAVDSLTYATTAGEYDFETTTVSPGILQAGVNAMAVEVHQGNASSSDVSFEAELNAYLSAPANNKPVVSITSPPDGTTVAAPGNFALTASAMDIDGSVASVAFYADGIQLGIDASSPYTHSWNNVPVGAYLMTAVATDALGLSATSSVMQLVVSTDITPPTVATRSPAPGSVTSLTGLVVGFSKNVIGVNAADLLINGVPADAVSGAGRDYVFSFAQPPFGAVNITWRSNADITDVFTPPHPFDPSGAGASWQYNLVDVGPPFMAVLDPLPNATVAALSTIRVTMNEPVTGVDASDLHINGAPATSRTGSGAGPYMFTFAPPPPGPVQLAWANGHGIRDSAGNAFPGGSWSYVLDPSVTGVVISEIMYHPASENVLEEYIELFNRGAAAVDLTGWRISSGVQFTFPPNVSIAPGGYLVVAADLPTFTTKYPAVANVVGGWTGNLSNTREDIDLDDALGDRVDSVVYADEGDWGFRQLDLPDLGVRGWIWTSSHDGDGASAELINPDLSNNHGQNWAASLVPEGTPGERNSVFSNNIAPMVLDVRHFPPVPGPAQNVVVTARVVDETVGGITVRLHHRVDTLTPAPFSVTTMNDDGTGADAVAGDGLYSAVIPPQSVHTVVEFYVEATDAQDLVRTWPAPAVDIDGTSLGQSANLLYQVDDDPRNLYAGTQQVYKLIMTELERSLLASIPGISTLQAPNSQMNGTFVSQDAGGVDVRYLVGFRNRGHGTRRSNPPNYRVNFRTDDRWKGVEALNLNSQQVHAQHFGTVIARRAGAGGPASVAVQVRVNNANLAVSGPPMFGSYAANEPVAGDWAKRHVPGDDNGNVYRAVRDIIPPEFDYRTLDAYPQLYGAEEPLSYQNTWTKETNVSEDDWTDLIAMLRVMGLNGVTPFTTQNVNQVVNVEQWLRHFAVMNLLGNSETGLNSGYNDDYYFYRGEVDSRFSILYWDLDQILGINSFPPTGSIFSATANNGSGAAMNRFLHWPDFEPRYFQILQELVDGPFSAPQFSALLQQTLGDYVPAATLQAMEAWMDARRTWVQDAITGLVPPASVTPRARLSGVPRSPTPFAGAAITVGGIDITHYRFQLDGAAYSPESSVSQTIQLSGLSVGSHTLSVLGRNSAGDWQAAGEATTRTWVVNPSWPTVRINEVLARNVTAFDHQGTSPDLIELFNEGTTVVDLSGMRLTDNPNSPDKFIFAPGTTLNAGAHLVLFANNPDGTSGIHLGFGLSEDGERVHLYHRVADGGALLDSVEFGLQLPDRSIGRLGSGGEWLLAQPTPGAPNVAQPLGDPANLRINEWLAYSQTSFGDDFVELYNRDSLPVALGGLFLTDAPNGTPFRHVIPDLCFVEGNGFREFIADGSPARGADHVDFRLDADHGEIALIDAVLGKIDHVLYGPQLPDLSTGRCPDGELAMRALTTPTPGAANLCPVEPPTPETVTLVRFGDDWRFNATGTDLGTAWSAPAFNDAAWPKGPGLLARENCGCLPEPIGTLLTFTSPQQITFYFRTHFNFPAGLDASAFELTHVLDDGAIFYLNGIEVGRANLPGGAVAYDTLAAPSVGDATYGGPLAVPLGLVQTGDNVLAVEVHQQSSTSSDLVFGLRLDALIVTNTATLGELVINEVFAHALPTEDPSQTMVDGVELYNLSAGTIDLADASLSDHAANPRRWVFPAGSIIPSQGHFTVRFDSASPMSSTNTGFGLSAQGGAVYLFARPTDGGALLNSVNYGLQPAGWSIGRIPDGAADWTLTLPTLGTENLAAVLASQPNARINEWMASPATGDDWFELYNPNPQPMDISGLHLTDRLDQPNQHVLPPLSFLGAGLNGFQKFVADGNTDAGADHVSFALSASGDTIGLATSDALSFLDTVSFGPQQPGVSAGRFPDGTAAIVSFVGSATPGRSNYLPLPNVVVNEVLSHTDLPFEDAVEFHNPSGDDVNIGGWWLSDSGPDLRKYRIPANTMIPALGYLVIYEYEFNGPDADSRFAFSSARGDEVILSQTDTSGNLTGYRAVASFGPSANGVSIGRCPTSQGPRFVALAQRTFGVDNPATVAAFRTGTGLANAPARVGPIVISEIMFQPPGGDSKLEFVELQNIAVTNVPLYDLAHTTNTWRMRDGIEIDFPADLTIAPGSFLLVVPFNPATDTASRSSFEAVYGGGHALVGPYSGSLSDAGERLDLLRPDPPQTVAGPDFGFVPYILTDRVEYRSQTPWPPGAAGSGASLQKVGPALFGDDPMNWIAAAPTPSSGQSSAGDRDGDGMPDDWELVNGLNPDVNDASIDSDADGMTNLEEFQAGTNPADPDSRLALQVTDVSDGATTLSFTGIAGRTYTVQYRDSWHADNWVRLTNIDALTTTRAMIVTDLDATGNERYYRLVTPALP